MSTLAEQVVEQLKTDMDNLYDAGYQKGKSEGGGENLFQYMKTLSNVFEGATFPENYVLELDVPNVAEIKIFASSTGLKKVVLKNAKITGTMYRGFYNTSPETLEIIDMSTCTIKPTNFQQTFIGKTLLKSILGEIDLSASTTNASAFSNTPLIEDICFVRNSIKLSIAFNNNPLLSDTSIQSIIDGLADLTGQATQTLTFSTGVKAKLTDEQIASITAKNWTLA